MYTLKSCVGDILDAVRSIENGHETIPAVILAEDTKSVFSFYSTVAGYFGCAKAENPRCCASVYNLAFRSGGWFRHFAKVHGLDYESDELISSVNDPRMWDPIRDEILSELSDIWPDTDKVAVGEAWVGGISNYKACGVFTTEGCESMGLGKDKFVLVLHVKNPNE